MALDCSHHYDKSDCCRKCECDCHKRPAGQVRHVMACCRTCPECKKQHRKVFPWRQTGEKRD
jgi:hypothetical protein